MHEVTGVFAGKYATGCGQAHLYGDQHIPAFRRPMVGTFNVDVDGYSVSPRFAHAKEFVTDEAGWNRYWLVKIGARMPGRSGEWTPTHYAWAYRWEKSRMPGTTWELLSKSPLPDSFKGGELGLEVCLPWTPEQIQAWATSHYQFQGFDWLPVKRADSLKVWQAIEPHATWAGATVLDIGSHYGYHSFKASDLGAEVVAVEPDDDTRACGVEINDHIEMQDVHFQPKGDMGTHDIILYLSVHHQHDPEYTTLAETIAFYKTLARKHLFVECILPPMFGKGVDVDAAVGGEVLLTYPHKVRGTRRIYHVQGEA
jgi:hypothetical protein